MARPQTINARMITECALALADEHGLDAVSMRNVANQLGVAAQALYRHVGSKDELLARMADNLLADVSIPQDPDWREAVVEYFAALRDLMLEHHGLAELMIHQTTGSPAVLEFAETMLAAMEADGVDLDEAVRTLAMLQWSALGSALHAAARSTRQADSLPPAIAAAAADNHPALYRARTPLSERERGRQFREGVRQLLAGLGDPASGPEHQRRTARRR